MMRRARVGHRGITLIEVLGASMIATIVGGSIILLMNGMRQAYQAHTTYRQLSGYLDVASTTLRNDIWGARSASPATGSGAASGVCPNDWLKLENSSQPTVYPVVYCLDETTDAADVRLRRTQNDGSPPWAVAHHVLKG